MLHNKTKNCVEVYVINLGIDFAFSGDLLMN